MVSEETGTKLYPSEISQELPSPICVEVSLKLLYEEVKKFESLKIIEIVRQGGGNGRACAHHENHIKGCRDIAALILTWH